MSRKPNLEEYYTSEKIADWIKKALGNIDREFVKNDITYWIDGGTLLGQVRQGGLMKWDDDADLVILKEDIDKVWDLEDTFKKLGYKLAWGIWGESIIKLYDPNGTTIKKPKMRTKGHTGKRDYKYPYIDIQIIEDNKKGKYVYNPALSSFYDNKFYYKTDEVLPLKRVKFSGLTLNAPKNPKPYLDRGYKNWKNEVFMGGFSHRLERKQKGIKTQMTPFLKKEIY